MADEPSEIKTYFIYSLETRKVLRKLTIPELLRDHNFTIGEGCMEVSKDTSEIGASVSEEGTILYEEGTDPEQVIAEIKALRNSYLSQTAWTYGAASPLTPECQEAFRSWHVQLNRWLYDYPDGSVPLPDMPEYVYQPLSEQV